MSCRVCCRRKSAINVALLTLLVSFYTTSLMIFHVLEDKVAGNDRSLLDKFLVKVDGRKETRKDWTKKVYAPNAVFRPGVLGNYEPKRDLNRTGPGEYGRPVPQEESEMLAIRNADKEYGFNMVNSDKISLDRIVNDIRHPECKYWHYPEELPTASVVLVFHNEGWSTFVRTVHSVINMSPQRLLHEVLLVDDGSDKEHLKSRLEDHMKQFGNKVKIIRNKDREGLIRSRSIGARAATGQVVIFLDAHCECSPNWLPPLLTRIAYDRTIMAAPIVDSIDWTTFEYRSNYLPNVPSRGMFEWGFFYKEMPVPDKELSKRKHKTEPYWSPTNAGGLFAIDREYFLHLGAYDPQLDLWGGENFELAFKIWQCGGSSEWVPCSRVGHIYRHHSPDRKYTVKTKLSPTLINYVRVVEVWMDEPFKEYFYRREPQTRGYPTNISRELRFRHTNKCKNFNWFIDNVAYDIYKRFPPPPPNKAWGRISARRTNGSRCLEFTSSYKGKSALGTTQCNIHQSIFRLNTLGQIGIGEQCVMAYDSSAVTKEWCSTTDLTGPWDWNEISGHLYNKDRQKCVSLREDNGIQLLNCNDSDKSQQWDITEFYSWK